MTILAYTVKDILSLVPEAASLIKEASLNAELPLDNVDSCIASGLQLGYFTQVQYRPVDQEDFTKVAKALELYGVKDTVSGLVNKMVKTANRIVLEKEANSVETLQADFANFEGNLSGRQSTEDFLGLNERAQALVKRAAVLSIEPSPSVKLYAGAAPLNKEAASIALKNRFNKTKDTFFEKAATALDNTDYINIKQSDVAQLAIFVNEKDVEHNLHLQGHSFYKEAFFTKEADFKSALYVNICGTKIPYESIEKVGSANFSSYIGADVAKEMSGGPVHFKQVLETLPADLQGVVCNLVKNV